MTDRALAVRTVEMASLPDDAPSWRRRMTPTEDAACRMHDRPLMHLAARLAAKQAFFALLNDGDGGDREEPWHDVEIVGAPRSQPRLVLHGGTAHRAAAEGLAGVAVSLSHTATRAGACVAAGSGALAVGIDLLDVDRWVLALHRSMQPLVARVTSAAEAEDDRRRGVDSSEQSGARFSVKECVVKALGGFPARTGFRDLDVLVDGDTVQVHATGALAAHMSRQGVRITHAELVPLDAGHLRSLVVLAA